MTLVYSNNNHDTSYDVRRNHIPLKVNFNDINISNCYTHLDYIEIPTLISQQIKTIKNMPKKWEFIPRNISTLEEFREKIFDILFNLSIEAFDKYNSF